MAGAIHFCIIRHIPYKGTGLMIPDLIELGMAPVGNSELEFARVIQSDLLKWAKVVKARS